MERRSTPEDVRWCYRLLLGREPESPTLLIERALSTPSLIDLVSSFLGSEEFQQRFTRVSPDPVGAGAGPGIATSRLAPGTSLTTDGRLISDDGAWELKLRAEEGLAVSDVASGAVTWRGEAAGKAAQLVMQDDGNLVVYDAQYHPIWSSGTSGRPGAVLLLRNDGTVVVADGAEELWTSSVATVRPSAVLDAGSQLAMGEWLCSANGQHGLHVQGDGNLVAYRMHDGETGSPVWATATRGEGARLQLDVAGTLRLESASGSELWRAPCKGADRLEVTDDGEIQLLQGETVLWTAA